MDGGYTFSFHNFSVPGAIWTHGTVGWGGSVATVAIPRQRRTFYHALGTAADGVLAGVCNTIHDSQDLLQKT